MRSRVPAVLLLLVVAVLGSAPPAGAGGWWGSVHVPTSHVARGDSFVATSEAYYDTVDEAEAAGDRPFFAYLVRGYDRALLRRAMTKADPQRWWAARPGTETVRVGRVRTGAWNANVGEATAKVTIPDDLPAGRWHLMFCDAGCREPFASVIPTRIGVFATSAQAEAAAAIAAVRARSAEREMRVRGALQDARYDARLEAAAAQRNVDRLTARILELQSAAGVERPPVWPWVAAGAAGGALLVALLTRRRRPGASRQAGDGRAAAVAEPGAA